MVRRELQLRDRGVDGLWCALIAFLDIIAGLWGCHQLAREIVEKEPCLPGLLIDRHAAALLLIGRFGGRIVTVNSALLLLTSCVYFWTYRRGSWLARFLPLDNMMPIWHARLAIVTAIAAALHTAALVAVYASTPLHWGGALWSWSGGGIQVTQELVTGALLVAVLGGMVVVPRLRHRWFRTFWVHHQLGLVLYLVLLVLHGCFNGWPISWCFLAAPVLFYITDRCLRIIKATAVVHGLAKVTAYEGDVIILEFARPFQFRPGMYARICVPQLSAYEFHPFTMASSPLEHTIRFYIKVTGDWTRALHELAWQKPAQASIPVSGKGASPLTPSSSILDGKGSVAFVTVKVTGPFGAPAQHFSQFAKVVLVSTGIGVTPMSAIIRDLFFRRMRVYRELGEGLLRRMPVGSMGTMAQVPVSVAASDMPAAGTVTQAMTNSIGAVGACPSTQVSATVMTVTATSGEAPVPVLVPAVRRSIEGMTADAGGLDTGMTEAATLPTGESAVATERAGTAADATLMAMGTPAAVTGGSAAGAEEARAVPMFAGNGTLAGDPPGSGHKSSNHNSSLTSSLLNAAYSSHGGTASSHFYPMNADVGIPKDAEAGAPITSMATTHAQGNAYKSAGTAVPSTTASTVGSHRRSAKQMLESLLASLGKRPGLGVLTTGLGLDLAKDSPNVHKLSPWLSLSQMEVMAAQQQALEMHALASREGEEELSPIESFDIVSRMLGIDAVDGDGVIGLDADGQFVGPARKAMGVEVKGGRVSGMSRMGRGCTTLLFWVCYYCCLPLSRYRRRRRARARIRREQEGRRVHMSAQHLMEFRLLNKLSALNGGDGQGVSGQGAGARLARAMILLQLGWISLAWVYATLLSSLASLLAVVCFTLIADLWTLRWDVYQAAALVLVAVNLPGALLNLAMTLWTMWEEARGSGWSKRGALRSVVVGRTYIGRSRLLVTLASTLFLLTSLILLAGAVGGAASWTTTGDPRCPWSVPEVSLPGLPSPLCAVADSDVAAINSVIEQEAECGHRGGEWESKLGHVHYNTEEPPKSPAAASQPAAQLESAPSARLPERERTHARIAAVARDGVQWEPSSLVPSLSSEPPHDLTRHELASPESGREQVGHPKESAHGRRTPSELPSHGPGIHRRHVLSSPDSDAVTFAEFCANSRGHLVLHGGGNDEGHGVGSEGGNGGGSEGGNGGGSEGGNSVSWTTWCSYGAPYLDLDGGVQDQIGAVLWLVTFCTLEALSVGLGAARVLSTTALQTRHISLDYLHTRTLTLIWVGRDLTGFEWFFASLRDLVKDCYRDRHVAHFLRCKVFLTRVAPDAQAGIRAALERVPIIQVYFHRPDWNAEMSGELSASRDRYKGMVHMAASSRRAANASGTLHGINSSGSASTGTVGVALPSRNVPSGTAVLPIGSALPGLYPSGSGIGPVPPAMGILPRATGNLSRRALMGNGGLMTRPLPEGVPVDGVDAGTLFKDAIADEEDGDPYRVSMDMENPAMLNEAERWQMLA
eukprot:jgi/Mesvir1/5146/Mv15289-RA.1